MTRKHSLGMQKSLAIAFTAFGLVGMGCAIDAGESNTALNEERVGEAWQGMAGEPSIPNHLRPSCLFDHGVQEAVRELGEDRISTGFDSTLPEMPSMPSENARSSAPGCRSEFLDVLVSCAMPKEVTLKDPETIVETKQGPAPKTYQGALGLAPDWQTRALTTTEKEQLTACVMARTNRFGKTVWIMLDGQSAALKDDPAFYGYSHAESTVWGNMFDSKTPLDPSNENPTGLKARAFEAHVCHNNGGGYARDASLRVCDEGGCGFIEHGDCETAVEQCESVSGQAPQHCSALSNGLSVFLKAQDPILLEMPQTRPIAPLPAPIAPKAQIGQ